MDSLFLDNESESTNNLKNKADKTWEEFQFYFVHPRSLPRVLAPPPDDAREGRKEKMQGQ